MAIAAPDREARYGAPVAPNDPRELTRHPYAEGVRVSHGSDGRTYRLCSGCGRPRNAPAHRGFAPPLHPTLTAADVHPFAPGGRTVVDARGANRPTCAQCGQVKNSLRHRGPGVVGSTAPGPLDGTPRAALPQAPDPDAERRANHGYPLTSPDRHPYVAGTDVLVRINRGHAQRLVKCATCDQPANSPRHRKLPGATKPRYYPAHVVGGRHPYTPGDRVTHDKRGHRLVLCATCELPGNAPGHRGQSLPQVPPRYAPESRPRVGFPLPARAATTGATPVPARAPERIKAPPAELALLAIALDTVLALPVGAIDGGLFVRVAALRQTLDVPRLATLAPPPPELDADAPQDAPSAPETAPSARPIPRPITGPAAAAPMLRGIRSDKVRALVKRAIADGWEARKTGSGHIALTRNDRSLIVSATGTNKGGHWWENVRAEARRAGVNVAGL